MTLPTWSHCIPTLNRVDILLKAVRLSLAQTCPPLELVIVDASTNWAENRTKVEPLLEAHPQVRLIYLPCTVRSITVQRNLATEAASGDILFCFDDDTMMHPDCAETILKVYAADTEGRIAGVTANNDPVSPLSTEGLERKSSAIDEKAKRGASVSRSRLMQWVWREVFLMNTLRLFVPYDEGRPLAPADEAARLGQPGLTPVLSMIGYAMTVRRSVALREPFEPHLLAYAPCEDTDATYRFSRHGLLVLTDRARLHHFEIAAARLKRRQVAALFLMNVAYFTRKHSNAPEKHRKRYFHLARRRILAEFLKDGLTRRFSFPQVAGTLYALRKAPEIFALTDAELGPRYEAMQREVLAWK